MTLIVLPTLPSDLSYPSQVYDSFFLAFQTPASPLLSILFPHADVSSVAFRTEHDKHAASFVASPAASFQYPVKCIDTDLASSSSTITAIADTSIPSSDIGADGGLVNNIPQNPVVGMGVFEVYWRTRTPSEWAPPSGVDWMVEGSSERSRAEEVLGALWRKKAEIWEGRRYVYCQTVAVHPSHRLRGIASLLMQWGIDVAERLGLPIYLEATSMAVPMYEKLGFSTLRDDHVIHRKEVLGTDTEIEVPLMVRMPNVAKGISFEDWREKGFPADY